MKNLEIKDHLFMLVGFRNVAILRDPHTVPFLHKIAPVIFRKVRPFQFEFHYSHAYFDNA